MGKVGSIGQFRWTFALFSLYLLQLLFNLFCLLSLVNLLSWVLNPTLFVMSFVFKITFWKRSALSVLLSTPHSSTFVVHPSDLPAPGTVNIIILMWVIQSLSEHEHLRLICKLPTNVHKKPGVRIKTCC